MWLILSDIHIGDKHSDKQLPKLFDLLEEYSNKNYTLILNGDIFDFAKNLAFDKRHRTFLSLIQKYENIIYIEGNHDWFVSGLKNIFPKIEFKKELLLKLGNKIIKIIHGHQTDNFVMKMPKINRFLVKLNSWIYDIFKIDIQHYARNTKIVQKFMLEKQETKLIKLEKIANILIAGHTHRPYFKKKYGIEYYNTGDWVENSHCAYVLIENNKIELIKV